MKGITGQEAGPSLNLRVPASTEVRAIVEAHARWLETHGREGEPAHFDGLDLSGFNLRGVRLSRADLDGWHAPGADLSGADLSRASLRGVDLSGAVLTGANLQGADLQHARLDGCQLRQAILRDVNLLDTNLEAARGLLPGQLGGTNLTGAVLPPEVSRFEGLGNVAEASKAAQNLFTSILFVCAYTWLTIASATDAQLVNAAAAPSSRLPIVGIDIPLVRFFIASPLLLVCLYIYFHLMLQRLWEELAELPAIFPDGRAVDKKAYPWLLNVLVRAHVPRLQEGRTYLAQWQARISSLLAWGLVPGTVFFAWVRYLHAHDWIATSLHMACLSLTVGTGVAFWRLASSTLRGSERRAFLWQQAWKDARALCVLVTLGTACAVSLVSFGAIEGVNPQSVYDTTHAERLARQFHPLDVRRWVPIVMEHLRFSSSATLTDAALSIKPANWTPNNPDLLPSVRGADLEHRRFSRNLRHTLAFNAFCANAYFQESDLRWSDFRQADLRGADFRRAWLEGINFRFANLGGADFRNADLTLSRFKQVIGQNARFEEAILTRAVLSDSEFQGANFSQADLTEADLSNSKFFPLWNLDPAKTKTTTLTGANLTSANLTGANLASASLQPADRAGEPGKSQPTRLVRAKLQKSDLTGTNLTGADLTGADLTGAILTGARLDQTILREANLTGAIGLTREQLNSAVVDVTTILPEEFADIAFAPKLIPVK